MSASTKYAPAATEDPSATDPAAGNSGGARVGQFEVKEQFPSKEKKTCFQKFACCACSFGFIFLVAGVVW